MPLLSPGKKLQGTSDDVNSEGWSGAQAIENSSWLSCRHLKTTFTQTLLQKVRASFIIHINPPQKGGGRVTMREEEMIYLLPSVSDGEKGQSRFRVYTAPLISQARQHSLLNHEPYSLFWAFFGRPPPLHLFKYTHFLAKIIMQFMDYTQEFWTLPSGSPENILQDIAVLRVVTFCPSNIGARLPGERALWLPESCRECQHCWAGSRLGVRLGGN